MKRPGFGSERRRQAAKTVRDYLLCALPPRSRGVPLDDVLCAAESIWNNYEPGAPPPSFEETGVDAESPAFRALVQKLHRARSGRFGSARFFIFALDYCYEGLDVLFACDLMWPGEPVSHGFELRVDRAVLSPPEWN